MEREIERLSRDNERLREELIEKKRQLSEAEKQIADLERKLGLRQQNSTTSSKPPSSDGLAGPQRERGRKKKSRRKPGGQPGHPGHWRGLAPAARVNEVVKLYPSRCGHCDRRLPATGKGLDTQGEPRRHQVTELPRIEAHITEYQCHRVLCPDCGQTTQAQLPDEAQGQFGPELTALMAYLTVVCRMPRRVLLELLSQVLGIPLSLGSAQKAWEEASAAVAEPCEELERQLRREPVLNSDETGYRTNGEKRWLWALVAPGFVFYKIAASRGAEVLVQLLGAVLTRSAEQGRPYPRISRGVNLCLWSGDSLQRPLSQLPEIPQGRGSVLLGAFQTQHSGRAGDRQNNRGGTILPRRPGFARAPVPLVASLPGRAGCEVWADDP